MLDCDYTIKVNAYKDRQNIILRGVNTDISAIRVNFELAFYDFIMLLAHVIGLHNTGEIQYFINPRNSPVYHNTLFNSNGAIEILSVISGKKVKILLCDAGADLHNGNLFNLKKSGFVVDKKSKFSYTNN